MSNNNNQYQWIELNISKRREVVTLPHKFEEEKMNEMINQGDAPTKIQIQASKTINPQAPRHPLSFSFLSFVEWMTKLGDWGGRGEGFLGFGYGEVEKKKQREREKGKIGFEGKQQNPV